MAPIAIVFIIVVYLAFKYAWIFYYNRGSAYMNKGQYDRAILCFDKAVKINKNSAQAYCNRGTAYYEKKEYDRAILDFNKAVKINTKFAHAYYNRAVVYAIKGEYDKAWQDVCNAQSLGHQVPREFLKNLREASEK